MDNMSLRYLTDMQQKLIELSATNGSKMRDFIAAELKAFGGKPRTFGSGVYCDIGSGKSNAKLLLYADCKDKASVEFIDAEDRFVFGEAPFALASVLMNVARTYDKERRVRLAFRTDSICELDGDDVLNGIEAAYSVRFDRTVAPNCVGYAYGATAAGGAIVDCRVKSATGDSAFDTTEAADVITAAAVSSARANGVEANICDRRDTDTGECVTRYDVRFYDTVRCEAVLLDMERAALGAVDDRGGEHYIETAEFCSPLNQCGMAVDRLRMAVGGQAAEVAPSFTPDGFAEISKIVCGCTAYVGYDGDIGKAMLAAARLTEKIIEIHSTNK